MRIKPTITLLFFRNRTGRTHTIELRSWFFVLLLILILLIPTIPSTYKMLKLYFLNAKLNMDIISLSNEKKVSQDRLLLIKQYLASTTKKTSVKLVQSANEENVNLNIIHLRNGKIIPSIDMDSSKLYFEIEKRVTDGKKLRGYTVVVWKLDGNYFIFPKDAEVNEGYILNPKLGRSFVIRYKKEFRVSIPVPFYMLESLVVLIYNDKGELMLRQGYNTQ